MRNAKSLVQIQVTDVATKFTRRSDTDQGVHVGAVDVDAPTVGVHQCAQLLDLGFEDAVRAGVGDHRRRQVLAVLFAFRLQIGHVHITVGVAGRHHYLQTRHGSARRVGAVGARRNQADVAMTLPVILLIGANRQQAGVFPLRAGIRLQADASVTGGLTEPVAQLGIELTVTLELLGRCKRVHGGELGPGDRDHLAGGVELHGATAERNHAAVQRQVLVTETADVAQHAGLAVVRVEHRVRQVAAGAQQRGGQQGFGSVGKGGQCRRGLPRLGED